MWYSRLDPSAKPEQLTLVMGSMSFLLNLIAKLGRDLYAKHFGPQSLTVAALFLVLVVGCASDMTPRQKFFNGQVGVYAGQTAIETYLNTPYGQKAPPEVVLGLTEASDEATQLLKRLRPLVPDPGEEIADKQTKELLVGLQTLGSLIERMDRVLLPEMYKEE